MDLHIVSALLAQINITPDLSKIESIPALIKFIFDFAILVVGLAVLIQFIRAGAKIFLAAGNASKIGEGNTMMTNAVVGSIILFSSVLLLNIINPDLTSNALSPNLLKSLQGGDYTIQELGTQVSQDVAEDRFAAAGIDIDGGVSVDGVRQSTIDYIEYLYNLCAELGEGCDGWSVDRGTNYGGSSTASQSLYENGFVLGIDSDGDLEDLFEAYPGRFENIDGGLFERDAWRDTRTGATFVQYGVNNYEITVQ